MTKVIKVYIFRVFVNQNREFGNPVGIVIDEKQEINPEDRQKIAAKLNFSESVFINNLKKGNVSIFNPITEVKFAGHALVGTAYFINDVLGKQINYLECKAGKIKIWKDDTFTWIGASLENTPPWKFKQLSDSFSLENLSVSEIKSMKHTMVWTWIDKKKGIIRARTFAPDWGITEDEANGSGSMKLTTLLNKKIEVHHGKGSIIYVKKAKEGFAEVGGRAEKEPAKLIGL